MTVPPGAIGPATDAPVVALTIPLFIDAGAVKGTAIALARDPAAIYYLVDAAAAEGPPIWVHEGQVERCRVAPLGSTAP